MGKAKKDLILYLFYLKKTCIVPAYAHVDQWIWGIIIWTKKRNSVGSILHIGTKALKWLIFVHTKYPYLDNCIIAL